MISSSGGESGTSRVNSKRKTERGHEEDPEREDGQCMRTEGIKRKTVEEEEREYVEENREVLDVVAAIRGEEGI